MDKATQLRRFQIAIDVMTRVQNSKKRKFYLGSWNGAFELSREEEVLGSKAFELLAEGDYTDKKVITAATKHATEKNQISCGTSACFSGWMALAKETKAEGAQIEPSDGSMLFNGKGGPHGMAEFLGITLGEAEDLVYPINYDCVEDYDPFDDEDYEARVSRITPADVIVKLDKLMEKYFGKLE